MQRMCTVILPLQQPMPKLPIILPDMHLIDHMYKMQGPLRISKQHMQLMSHIELSQLHIDNQRIFMPVIIFSQPKLLFILLTKLQDMHLCEYMHTVYKQFLP